MATDLNACTYVLRFQLRCWPRSWNFWFRAATSIPADISVFSRLTKKIGHSPARTNLFFFFYFQVYETKNHFWKTISRRRCHASLDATLPCGCANQRRRQNNSIPQLTTLRASRAACVAFVIRLCLKRICLPTFSDRRSVLTTLRKKVDFRNVAFFRTPKSWKKHENTRLGLLIYVFFGENGPPTRF